MLLLLSLLPDASAKDLRSHVALGVHQPVDIGTAGGSLTQISFRFGMPTGKPSIALQLELDAGFRINASSGEAGYGGGLRLLYGLVVEDNMNLYGVLGGGYQQAQEGPGGVRIAPALSAEFFPFGLENLGLTVEWGLNIDIGEEFIFGTAPALGLHYWF